MKIRNRLSAFQENFFKESDRRIGWVPVLFGLGIGIYFALPVEPSEKLILFFLETLLFCLYLARRSDRLLLFLSALLIILLGFTDIFVQTKYRSKNVEIQQAREDVYLRGKIAGIDTSSTQKMRLSLVHVSDEKKARKGLYRVTTASPDPALKEGMCVEMIATLLPQSLPVMPDGYQFGRKSFYEGISASGYVGSKIYEIDCDEEDSFSERLSAKILNIRRRMVRRIQGILSADESAIASALIAGIRDDISPRLTVQYRDSGLAHFLSISGLHMGMIATLAFFLVRLILAFIPRFSARYNSKKSAAVVAIVLSFIYLVLSGGKIPTQRAFIMTFVVFLGILFDRRAISMRMLAISALVILVISPQALISVSFQMSFGAVTLLVAFYERYAGALNRFLSDKSLFGIIVTYLAGLLISDFVASVATLPFAVYHFNRIAIYTSLGNLLAGPIIGLIVMPFVLISLILMPFGSDIVFLKIVGFGVAQINTVTAWVSSLPHAGFQVLSMPFWGLLCLVFGGLWLCLWQRSWRLYGWIPIVFGLLSLLFVQKPDILYDSDGRTFFLRDQTDNPVCVSPRSDPWICGVWAEKMLSRPLSDEEKQKLSKIRRGKLTDPSWLDLKCDGEKCVYKKTFEWFSNGLLIIAGHKRNAENDGGGAVWSDGSSVRLKTICEDVGIRPWTPCFSSQKMSAEIDFSS